MRPRTVLIADSSEDFCKELNNILRWDCQVETCRRGRKALKLIHELRPEVLVLDLMLPELDGISLLKALSLSDCRPAILATTNLITPYIISAAQSMQVDYLMVKPCSIQAVSARVLEQLHRLEHPAETQEELRCRVSELLLMLGFSAKLHGYKYLREAILQLSARPEQSLTKELYPAVGQLFGSAGSHVERSIRGAIADAWLHRDPRIWLLFFPADGQGRESRPTNASLISRLADGLRTVPTDSPESAPQFIPSPLSLDEALPGYSEL